MKKKNINEIKNIKIKLSSNADYWWIFGRKGGETREKIINLLLSRPYNAHQISDLLEMSYRNIKHHLKVLQEASFILKNNQKYGKIYIIAPEFKRDIYFNICNAI